MIHRLRRLTRKPRIPGSVTVITAAVLLLGSAVGVGPAFGQSCLDPPGEENASCAVPAGSLKLAKVGDRLRLDWGASACASDTLDEVYERQLGSFFSHAPLLCDMCGNSAIITPRADSAYYLVVPTNATVEGSYGTSSNGIERGQGVASCRPQAIGCSLALPPSCGAADERYRAAVQAAKVCTPGSGCAACTLLVPDALDCGCTTYINPANTAAREAMQEAYDDWNAACCHGSECGAAECPEFCGAVCNAGRCSDCQGLLFDPPGCPCAACGS